MNNNFNHIFNKIPHIYGELFLTLFKNKLNYFTLYKEELLLTILERIFNNSSNINNSNLYYNYLKKDLHDINEDILEEISLYLSSDIDIIILKDIANKKFLNKTYINIDEFYGFNDKEKIILYKTITTYLLAKLLLRVILILNKYNTSIYKNEIDINIEKYYNNEIDLTNILDTYKNKYKKIITKDEYIILVYLLFISIKGKNIENKYKYRLNKIFQSIGYNTELIEIENISKYYDYLVKENNKYNSNIKELFNYKEKPLLPKNIKELIESLFEYNYDNYNFLINKDNILRTIYYILIRKLSIKDKIYICSNYKLWEYFWELNKNIYQEKKSN